MNHQNPHCRKWSDLRDDEVYWIRQALKCGGKMQYLYAKEGRWIDRSPELPRSNSKYIYRICPDYKIAVQLKNMTEKPGKSGKKAAAKKKKKKTGQKAQPKKQKQTVQKKKKVDTSRPKARKRASVKKEQPAKKKVKAKAKKKENTNG